MRIEMVDVQGQIEREIADPRMKRDDVALTYAFAIRQGRARAAARRAPGERQSCVTRERATDEVDFAKINRLIIDRWSLSALKYIKTKAWKKVEGG